MPAEKKWKKASRRRSRQAIFLTLIFHLALFASLLLATDTSVNDVLPKLFKEWYQGGHEEKVLPERPIP